MAALLKELGIGVIFPVGDDFSAIGVSLDVSQS